MLAAALDKFLIHGGGGGCPTYNFQPYESVFPPRLVIKFFGGKPSTCHPVQSSLLLHYL